MRSTKRSVPLPPVTGRLEIISLENYVDEVLEQIGKGALDLNDPAVHDRFRGWLVRVLSGFLSQLEWDITKGADRGVRQVLALVRDPDYYAKASERRKKQRAMMNAWRKEDATPTPPPARLLPQGVHLASQPFGVYLFDATEETGWQYDLVHEAATEKEAEEWIVVFYGPRSRNRQLRHDGRDRVELVRMEDRHIVKSFTVG